MVMLASLLPDDDPVFQLYNRMLRRWPEGPEERSDDAPGTAAG